MSFENWQKGYHEVKNIIHNEIGVTKEDVREVFREIAKEEIKKIVSERSKYIYEAINEVIEQEMRKAIEDHKYPKVTGNTWYFGNSNGDGKVKFKDYVAGVMKEEIVNRLEKQFSVSLNIDKKE